MTAQKHSCFHVPLVPTILYLYPPLHNNGKGSVSPVLPSLSYQAEEVEEKAAAVLPKGLLDMLADTKWKERLEACEKFQEVRDQTLS